MNPSRFRLPQHVPLDRQRARRATLAIEQETYQFASDGLAGNPTAQFELPPGLAGLPRSEQFGPEKKARLAIHKFFVQAQAPFIRVAMSGSPMDTQADYERVIGWLPRPRAADSWLGDDDFARQRLTGVNPKALFRWDSPPPEPLANASERVLEERYGSKLNTAITRGRLFGTDYSVLQDPLVQGEVRAGVTLAAPTCTFYVDDKGTLMPLAIQLRPKVDPAFPVATVLDKRGNWLMARAHAQCADAHCHEAVYHLLETHMVSEIFAVCTARHLHPDHPVRQLIDPHFKWNLAINFLARGDLLSVGGPIDSVLGAGVGGAMNAARLVWDGNDKGWSFKDHGFRADLAKRRVDGKELANYYYRDDAGEIFDALESYVDRITRLWYTKPEDVEADYELQAWAGEIASHIPNGFAPHPDAPHIRSRGELVSIISEVIFRASAGHSAVNNGQFDAFAFLPNVPGSISADLPGVEEIPVSDVLGALPGAARCVAAVGMAWTLSQPTHRSILATGGSPAFAADLNPEAYAAVDALRSRLQRISASIVSRNRELAYPYTYLDPTNVSRSTEI